MNKTVHKPIYIACALALLVLLAACATQQSNSTPPPATPPATPPGNTRGPSSPSQPPQVPPENPPSVPPQTPPTPPETPPAPPQNPGQETKEFSIVAKQFSYDPATITVNQGDKVIIRVTTADVRHGFAIDEYGIAKTIGPGQEAAVEFTADKKGTFTFYCNVPCGPGHKEMKGTLVVQ